MKSTLPSVNLLKFQRRDVATQFVDWALTVGRLLVIITEAVAFSMFAYRFVIDRQLVDAHDYIKKYQPYLAIESGREAEFRDIQDRLLSAKAHAGDTAVFQNSISTMVADAQGLVTFQDLKLSGKTMQVDAEAISVSSLKRFTDKVRAEPTTKTLSVDKIESNPAKNTITFSVSLIQK